MGQVIKVGIREKVTLIAAGILCLAIGVTVVTSDYAFRRAYADALQSRSLAIGKGLKLQLDRLIQFGIKVEELTGFEEQCQDIVKEYTGISYAMVVGGDGTILFHNNPAKQGQAVVDSAILRALKARAEGIVVSSEQGAEYYVAMIPVAGLRGEYVASVAVGFPVALVVNKTREMAVFGVVTGAASIATAVVGLLVFLSIFVTKPLGKLVGTIDEVRRSADISRRVNTYSKDELGALATAFNAMMENLEKTTVSKAGLASKVEERTRELLEVQEELVRKEKLAILGQVAGSVGHELRNPLGVMSNAVYFLQTVLSDADETTREYLDIIKNEIAGSERIVSDLLDSVRTKPPQPERVGLQALLEQTLGKLVIPSSITVKLDIPATLHPLRVDAMQIHQVFRNLISNGVEAMPQGGTLEIRATEEVAAQTVTVSIRDSGIGMAPEVLAKLFQPLFTTKARGIGLGLVVVKNLTQANGGTVAVQSEPGKGTTFSITLQVA
ncbi:MAG: hypothetical protein A3E79_15105 [Burkholderiales bacterium RIFCSPHIGHO2_12_FULL_61_11]|nr:MAG: hypothetical protein A3E79_15105 [Burkholderiales bacterium RIFCSPHIGHO2_12_FULL_61_11]